MPGPYFEGQQPFHTCGCYYPDITRISDDPRNGKRLLYCRVHGELPYDVEAPPDTNSPIPSLAWRIRERERIRKAGKIH